MAIQPLRIIFDLRRPVSRVEYVVASVLVVASWHIVSFVIYSMQQTVEDEWSILDTLELFLSATRHAKAIELGGLFWTLALVGVPFRWLLLSLAARRATDAGLKPWLGAVTLIPVFGDIAALLIGVRQRVQSAPPAVNAMEDWAPTQALLVFLSTLYTIVAAAVMHASWDHSGAFGHTPLLVRVVNAGWALVPSVMGCAAFVGGENSRYRRSRVGGLVAFALAAFFMGAIGAGGGSGAGGVFVVLSGWFPLLGGVVAVIPLVLAVIMGCSVFTDSSDRVGAR